jgi:hypothetical protein
VVEGDIAVVGKAATIVVGALRNTRNCIETTAVVVVTATRSFHNGTITDC